jgi:hypothetical protein
MFPFEVTLPMMVKSVLIMVSPMALTSCKHLHNGGAITRCEQDARIVPSPFAGAGSASSYVLVNYFEIVSTARSFLIIAGKPEHARLLFGYNARDRTIA